MSDNLDDEGVSDVKRISECKIESEISDISVNIKISGIEQC